MLLYECGYASEIALPSFAALHSACSSSSSVAIQQNFVVSAFRDRQTGLCDSNIRGIYRIDVDVISDDGMHQSVVAASAFSLTAEAHRSRHLIVSSKSKAIH